MVTNKFFLVFFINFVLLSCSGGKWYKQVCTIPLIENNRENELKVSNGKVGKNNILCDENHIYINNFFPHQNAVQHRQLAEIFKDHEINVHFKFDSKDFNEKITQADLDNIKKVNSPNLSGSPKPYIRSLLKFLKAVEIYLDIFQVNKAYITQLIDTINTSCSNYALLKKLKTDLTNKEKMGKIWENMHTEPLLLFDKFFDSQTNALKTPTEIIRFVSYLDMCENCEGHMTKILDKMGSCNEKLFKNNENYRYKILVGSFFPLNKIGEDTTDNKLLKIKLKKN